jgi:catechol 2,3-dioxygenase-like lactoylglutathione lyase family enzyme
VEVDDLDKECRRLLAAGVRFHCEPLAFSAAEKATYARDPDGNVFELLETTAQPLGERGIDR